jgi:hypothetical protein
MRAPLLLLFACTILGCSPPHRAPAAPPPAVVPVATTTTALPREPEARIEVSLAGPTRVLYSPVTMRAPRPSVRVVITNPASEPLDVSDLHVRLDVTRGSQSVRCETARADDDTRRREPVTVAPGASAVFIRNADCPLALVGTYNVQVVVAFGRTAPFANGIVTQEISLTVAAPPHAQPRAIASVPGLYAAIGSGALVPTSTSKGRIVVAMVNAKNERIALPKTYVALRVRRVGTDIPCEDEPTRLLLPRMLDGNTVLTRPVDVSCLGLGATGTYDVEARLLLGEEVFPIGSLRVEISTDPSHQNRRLLP